MNVGPESIPSPPLGEVRRTAGGIVNCAAYDSGGNRRDLLLDEISDVLADPGGGFVWLGLYEPDDALLDKLQEEFGCTTSRSRTRSMRTSGRRSRHTGNRCSWPSAARNPKAREWQSSADLDGLGA